MPIWSNSLTPVTTLPCNIPNKGAYHTTDTESETLFVIRGGIYVRFFATLYVRNHRI